MHFKLQKWLSITSRLQNINLMKQKSEWNVRNAEIMTSLSPRNASYFFIHLVVRDIEFVSPDLLSRTFEFLICLIQTFTWSQLVVVCSVLRGSALLEVWKMVLHGENNKKPPGVNSSRGEVLRRWTQPCVLQLWTCFSVVLCLRRCDCLEGQKRDRRQLRM